jgi:hypothetical protein
MHRNYVHFACATPDTATVKAAVPEARPLEIQCGIDPRLLSLALVTNVILDKRLPMILSSITYVPFLCRAQLGALSSHFLI